VFILIPSRWRAVLIAGTIVLISASQASATAPAVGLGASILTALPAIGTIVGKLFNPAPASNSPTGQKISQIKTSTSDGLKQVGTYAQREKTLWVIVAASDKAIVSMATMNYIAQNKPTLTESDINVLRSQFWPDVKQALDAIKSAVQDPTIFGPDQSQVDKITDIVDADTALKDKLETQFFRTFPHDAAVIAGIRQNTNELAGRFDNLLIATRDELDMIAKGLAEVAAAAKSTDQGKQQAANAVLDSAIKWSKNVEDAIKNSESLPRAAGARTYALQ
jgi:hypothetical protein